MQDKNHSKTKKILLDLAQLVNRKGIRGLALHLETPESTLYGWILRDKIADPSVILKKIPNARLEWLETGEGEMIRAGGGDRGELSPEEMRILQIVRECPEAGAVVQMMEDMDSDTQKDIQRYAEKEKRTQDRLKELQGKIAS